MHMKVITYADDTVLIANKQQQLFEIYLRLAFGITERNLNIGINISKCIMFTRNTRSLLNTDAVVLNGDNFIVVDQDKYFGPLMLKDIRFHLNTFYAKSNWLFRNLEYISPNVFHFLFNSFCIPHYRLSLWNIEENKKKPMYKSFKYAFTSALKRILSVPISINSHAVAEILN